MVVGRLNARAKAILFTCKDIQQSLDTKNKSKNNMEYRRECEKEGQCKENKCGTRKDRRIWAFYQLQRGLDVPLIPAFLFTTNICLSLLFYPVHNFPQQY